MADVLFYHLTEKKLEEALPPLLEKCVERNWRVAVQMRSSELLEEIDNLLWTYREDSFLPHGTDDGDHVDQQTVLLTTSSDNLNRATVRFLIDGADNDSIGDYERVVFLFDGFDQQQVEAARAQWKVLKAAGHALTYWQQDSNGRWSKKA